MSRHKIPIHLETPDKLLLGMTARQTLIVGLGCTLAYILFQSASWGPLLLVLVSVGALGLVLGSFLVAFVAPKRRGLEVWGMVILTYLLSPKWYVWRPLPQEKESYRPLKPEYGESEDE